MKILSLLAASASAIALVACSPANEAPPAVVVADEPAIVEPVAEEPVALPTIVDIAAGNPDFSTLVAAVQAAGLAETLSGPGPFTVFAPTNAAFAALPAGTVESLLLPENKDQLTKILTYHVVAGKVMAADLPTADAGVATATVAGLDLSVRVDADGVARANTATIASADIEASNGVIHVIDTVLLPKE